jgi:hypothetical protein
VRVRIRLMREGIGSNKTGEGKREEEGIMGKLNLVGDIREFAFALDSFLLVGVYGQWEESAACVGYEFASM